MELETRIAENMTLYSQWVRMWNGELELSDEIIGDEFVVHLTADSAADATQPPLEVSNPRAVRAWVGAIRSCNDNMAYNPQDEPSVSGSTVLAYWQATGKARTADRSNANFAKVGVDVLRVANGKFVECWTANFNAVACAV